jgi:hypothetical protein
MNGLPQGERYVMIEDLRLTARTLVNQVRAAAKKHNLAWNVLVPSRDVVDWSAEVSEEAAYNEMTEAKHALRQHICETYGITVEELGHLAIS